MKLVIYTCAYERYKVLKIYIHWINLIRQAARHFDIEVIPAIAAKDDHIRRMCRDNDIKYLRAENEPLGAKWNIGLAQLKEIDFDYLLIMGSDDVTSINMIFNYWQLMNKGIEFFGWTQFYLYDAINKRMKLWDGYAKKTGRKGESIGAGRLIKRTIIERLDWVLWDSTKKKHLDKTMTARIRTLGKIKSKTASLTKENRFLVDLKTKRNMSPYVIYKGEVQDAKAILDKQLPKSLTTKIFKL